MRHPPATLLDQRELLVLLFSLVAAATAGLGQTQVRAVTKPVETATAYLNQAPGIRYVGSKVCASCHEDIYRSYMRTLMGRSMCMPADSLQPKLPATPVTIHVEKFKRSYQIFRSGADIYQTEYELDPSGAPVFHDTRRISYVLGAGENGISYIVREGNYLFEAPLSYYTKSRTWELSPGYDFADYGFHREVPAACIICHSGRPRPVPNRPGLYEDPPFQQLTVGCENCHGPGALHVEERMKGAPLHGPIDRSIVNPANLPGWLANNVCMICHQGGDTRILQPGKTYLDFRPGAPLDKTVAIFAVPFTKPSPPKDPLLQQYTQMVLSKCYRASGGKMSCLTCHDPHFQPTAAEAPVYYRKKCLACHTEASCTLPLAGRLRTSPADNCIGCHMPPQKLQKISHSSLTNHRIIAYAGEPFPDAAFHMTTALLPDLVHVDRVPGKGRVPIPRMVLFQAYGELMESHPEYKPRYEQLLDALASRKAHNPIILSALGRRALLGGTAEGQVEARKDIAQAITAGSTVASDFELYADLLMRTGKMQEAIDVLKQGISLNPYATRLYKTLALAYIHTHQYGDALKTMKQELKIFPEDSFMRMLVARSEGSPGAPSPH